MAGSMERVTLALGDLLLHQIGEFKILKEHVHELLAGQDEFEIVLSVTVFSRLGATTATATLRPARGIA
jgi:hypothetical protein